MNFSKAILWALPLSLLSSLGTTAWARTTVLKILPSLDMTNPEACPQTLTAYETPRPYQAGGYATDGMVQLANIATNIRVAAVNDFSVIWVGTLKPAYRNCKATAGITTMDGEPYTGHSYLRLQINNGEARAILDMTGLPDANGFTSTILYHGLREGNPRWTMGGSD